MNVSVVIATHNRKEKLANCLHAIQKQDYNIHELILIDDASTDGTEDMLREKFPTITYHKQTQNGGPAIARNVGIRLATGDVVAFTDDDCIPPPDWLTQLVSGLQQNPQVVGVGGYQEASPAMIATNVVAKADHLLRVRRWGERATKPEIGGNEVPGLATNNVAYRREILLEIGGFDETFPVAAGEDADLKLRMSQQGGKLMYVPCKVEHDRPYTRQAQWRMAIRRGIGAYYFETKHSKPPHLGRILLRFLKRTYQFFPDLLAYSWQVAWIMYLTRIGDVLGQAKMLVSKS